MFEVDEISESVDADEELAADAGSDVLARAAWFLSYSAGPQYISRSGEVEGGGEGVGDRWREWSALGGPMVQLNSTMVTPLSVERLRVDVPPRAQTVINYVTDVPKNWELVL